VRLADLYPYVGLKRTQIEVLISQGRFPKPIRLADRAMGWAEDELIAWQQARIAERDAGASAKSEGDH
jgi:prophage regulatory protein